MTQAVEAEDAVGQTAENAAAREERRVSRLFWRYWSATTVSGVGDAVTSLALPLVAVVLLRASSFQVSLVTAASFAAWLVIGLPAGVIVERLPLRGTQAAMDLVRAAALLSVPVAAALHHLSVALLIAVALVVGLANVVFDVGNASLLPSLVSKEELTRRNSLNSGSNAATQLGGPSLGGLLVQFLGAATSLLVDVVSYVVSAVLMWSLPRPARKQAEGPSPSIRGMIAEGWRYVVRHPVIRPTLIMATVANFICGALLALCPFFLIRTLGASAGVVGVLMAAEGVGSLLGAALTPRLAERLGSARALIAAGLVAAAAALLIPAATSGWGLLLFGVGYTGYNGGLVVVSILTRTYRQTTTPPELLPRVMATVRFVSWGAAPLGALTAGFLSALLGPRAALAVLSLIACGVPLSLLLSPIRKSRDLVAETAR
jgi:MFS family permease